MKKWLKIKDNNSNYHMQKKGFQHLLKEISDSTLNLSKIRGGSSIYQDSSLKDQMTSQSNAPIFEDKTLRDNVQRLILESPSECVF